MKPEDNLRGWDVLVEFDGIDRLVSVVTHIRNGIWLVEGRTLPKRFERYSGCRRTTVARESMTLVAAPEAKLTQARAHQVIRRTAER
jgi:hypothetical protein